VANGDSGETAWRLSLAGGGVPWPAWMRVTVADGNPAPEA